MDLSNIDQIFSEVFTTVGTAGADRVVNSKFTLHCPFIPDMFFISNVSVDLLEETGGEITDTFYITIPSVAGSNVLGIIKAGAVQNNNNLYYVNKNRTLFYDSDFDFQFSGTFTRGQVLIANAWSINFTITYVRYKSYMPESK